MTASLLYGQPLIDFLRAGAQRRGDDPAAVLADADREGGFYGAVGDSGRSFGPFQLKVGGALPASVPVASARAWANSPTGLNYALDEIDRVAHGLKGQAAITAIVSKFERPADPAAEIADEIAIYGKYAAGASSGSSSGVVGTAGRILRDVEPFVPGLAPLALWDRLHIPGGIGAVFQLFQRLLALFADPVRLLEVLAGLVLLALGVVTLTRWLSRSQVIVQSMASSRALAGLVK